MSLLCGRTISWAFEPKLHSHELTEFNYIMFRIACHNIFPIFHVYTIPIDRCIFLYTLLTSGSICFPSLFIQTIVEVHRKNTRKQRLFFHVFLGRILEYIEVKCFPSLELVHPIAPIEATFLKQQSAQKKTIEPSVGTTKRPRVESTAKDVPIAPTTTVADEDDDDANVDAIAATSPSMVSQSLCYMLEKLLET